MRPPPSSGTAWLRRLSLAGGLLLIPGALIALGADAGRSLSGRTAEQLLTGELAPLLIAVGLQRPQLAQIARLLRPIRSLAALTSPIIAALLWATDLLVWHQPAIFESALHHPLLRTAQQICFFLFALNMWLALIGAGQKPRWFGELWRAGLVAGTRLAMAALANLLLWAGSVTYPYFIHPDVMQQLSPLVDENLAGALMLAFNTVIALALIAWLYARARTGRAPSPAATKLPAATKRLPAFAESAAPVQLTADL